MSSAPPCIKSPTSSRKSTSSPRKSARPPTNSPSALRKSRRPPAASPKSPRRLIPQSKSKPRAPKPSSAPWTKCASWCSSRHPAPPSFPPPPSKCSNFLATCSTAWTALSSIAPRKAVAVMQSKDTAPRRGHRSELTTRTRTRIRRACTFLRRRRSLDGKGITNRRFPHRK